MLAGVGPGSRNIPSGLVQATLPDDFFSLEVVAFSVVPDESLFALVFSLLPASLGFEVEEEEEEGEESDAPLDAVLGDEL